jgi:hypothetical protein
LFYLRTVCRFRTPQTMDRRYYVEWTHRNRGEFAGLFWLPESSTKAAALREAIDE